MRDTEMMGCRCIGYDIEIQMYALSASRPTNTLIFCTGQTCHSSYIQTLIHKIPAIRNRLR